MRLEDIVGNVLEAITGGDRRPEAGNRDVRPASEDPHGDPADGQHRQEGGFPGGVLPASQDPYGDPADVYNGQQVRPASEDPYGDPADQYNGQQVLPASQDPYGDPADAEQQTAAAPRRGGWPF